MVSGFRKLGKGDERFRTLFLSFGCRLAPHFSQLDSVQGNILNCEDDMLNCEDEILKIFIDCESTVFNVGSGDQ